MSTLIKSPTEPNNDMRVLVVDDHVSFLKALSSMLEQQPGFEVIGQAHGGQEGLKLAAETQPDLVVVDFAMPDMNGIEVIRQLKAATKPPKIVMMSFHNEPEYREMALHAGADAFLTKTDLHRELVPLLQRLGHSAG